MYQNALHQYIVAAVLKVR